MYFFGDYRRVSHGKMNIKTETKQAYYLCRLFSLLFLWGCSQAAQHAQKQSTELFQCTYFKDKTPETDERCIADGVIYSIRTNGVLVFVPR